LGAGCTTGSRGETLHDGADFRLLVENVTLTCPSQFKSFDPPVKLSKEEYRRLKEYYKPSPSPVTKVDQSPITLDSCSEEVDQSSITLDSCSEGDDDDDNWEDNMDPITFLRYYAASHPVLAKVVQEHDQKLRERFDQGIASWMEGVQSATS
jgi:hypothetical protein